MEKSDLRIVFMGTPEFAVPTLDAIISNGYNVVAVITQPDKPAGRHQDTLQPSPVKRYAVAKGIPVMQPVKMRDGQFVDQLRSFGANLQVVVAFRMLPEVVWAMPRYGTFNVHASLLPQYRGAAPINWAIINGETLTGVTTFFLDHEIDTGRIIMQKPFPIAADANVEDVYNGLMRLSAGIAVETIRRIVATDGNVPTMAQADMTQQPAAASPQGSPSDGAAAAVLHPAPKIFKDTCRIDWNAGAKRVYDFVRGLSPYPGAWTNLVQPSGRLAMLKIYRTSRTGISVNGIRDRHGSPLYSPGSVTVDGNSLFIAAADELLRIDELQLAGKKRMSARDFLNGMRNAGSLRAE